MIMPPIFLVLCMHIWKTRLLKHNAFKTKFDADAKLHLESTSFDLDDNTKIEKAIAAPKNNKSEEKNL